MKLGWKKKPALAPKPEGHLPEGGIEQAPA
jgi:hypothetical protein